jgi:hypothetical protein
VSRSLRTIGIYNYNYEDMLMRRRLGAFLINNFKGKVNCSSILVS